MAARAAARPRIALTAAAALAVAVASALTARAVGVRYLDPVFTDVTVTPGLVYGSAVNNQGVAQDLALDLYEPAGDTETSRPVIVWAHGGGFTGGTRLEQGIVDLATDFAKRGYVTASISYRVRPPSTPGSPTVPDLIIGSLAGQLPPAMHDAQRDMQAAVRWFRANAVARGVNPSWILVGGISAGASMALETAFNPEDDGTPGDPGDSAVAAAIPISGGSDVRRIEIGAPPIAMFHGTHDTTAPYPFAVMTCAGTIALTNECELTTYPGAGHNLTAHREDIVSKTADFACRKVLGGCAPSY